MPVVLQRPPTACSATGAVRCSADGWTALLANLSVVLHIVLHILIHRRHLVCGQANLWTSPDVMVRFERRCGWTACASDRCRSWVRTSPCTICCDSSRCAFLPTGRLPALLRSLTVLHDSPQDLRALCCLCLCLSSALRRALQHQQIRTAIPSQPDGAPAKTRHLHAKSTTTCENTRKL